jgi:hypothetical protein
MQDLNRDCFRWSERIQRALMVWGALVLFALGFYLLFAPKRGGDAESMKVGDNGVQRTVASDFHQWA